MSNTYKPDGWAILKHDSYYYVFGSWSGGYLGSDNWRRNSGVVKYEEDGDYYYFHGESGSVYQCSKQYNHIAGYCGGVLTQMVAANNSEIIEVEQFKEEFLNE